MLLVDPYILEQTWEWNFLKVHNLLNIKWIKALTRLSLPFRLEVLR